MSGIKHPAPQFTQPSNDYSRPGAKDAPIKVNIMPNMTQMATRTSERIFQVSSEQPESSELICSSQYRVRGSPFSFTTNIGGPLFRPRLLQLRHTILPMIPNINRQNHRVCIQMIPAAIFLTSPAIDWNPINIEFILPTKFYYPDTFTDDFVAMVRNAIIAQAPGQDATSNARIVSIDDIDVSGGLDYDTMRYSININIKEISFVNYLGVPGTVSGDNLLGWWFVEECSFIRRGRHFIHFLSHPLERPKPYTGADPTEPYRTASWIPPNDSIRSTQGTVTSLLGPSFIYTRYATVVSDALSLYAFGESRVDRLNSGGGGGKVIGVVSLSTYIDNHKAHFSGSLRVSSVDAPVMGVKNSQLKLNEMVDLLLEDEYGDSLDLAFPNDNQWGPTYAFVATY